MKVRKILVSQPRPAVVEKSPFHELERKYGLEMEYTPLIKVVGVTPKDFRSQRIDILSHSAVIFTSRTTIDSFFRICDDARITVPETMKYICTTEAIALYLQKYIVYRKRKISFADGSFNGLIEVIVKHREEKFLLALSEPHKPELPQTLAQLKVNFTPAILSRTVAADLPDLDIRDFDMVLIYSPWDVKALAEKYDAAALPAIATFGQGTLREAVSAGLSVMASAPVAGIPSLAKAVDIYCAKVAKGETVEPVVLEEPADNEDFIRTQQSRMAKKPRTRSSSAAKNDKQ